jgi:lipid II:glycine glycyltransferase (peptidoglycan interpeptide bridge formation enzyme)
MRKKIGIFEIFEIIEIFGITKIMKIIEITNKEDLNKFVAQENQAQFLQSWEWGEFQKAMGHKIFRLGVIEENNIVASALLIKKKLLPGKNYFYSPRGPELIINNEKLKIIEEFLFSEIEKISKREKVIFLRFEPKSKIKNLPTGQAGLESKIKNTLPIQPQRTLMLDLTKKEDALLKEMHQKTRYNIKLAEKKEVKIIEVGADRFEDFWKLISETGARDEFRIHNKEYYKKMISISPLLFQGGVGGGRQLVIKLFLAEYENKIIAGGIFAFFGDTVVYMHGASSNEYRNVMAPYLLQWQVIKLAKKLGYKYYDFYGIDEKKWPGVTRFKKGFAGFEIEYPGTFDLIFSEKWYKVYEWLRKIRRG